MGFRKRLNLQILLTLQGREGRGAQIDRFTFYPVVKRLLWQIKKKQNNRDYLTVRWIVLQKRLHPLDPAGPSSSKWNTIAPFHLERMEEINRLKSFEFDGVTKLFRSGGTDTT